MGSAPASAPLGANGHACGACHDLAHGAYVASAHAAATPPGGLAMPNSFDRFSAASADAGADAAGKVAAAIAAESAARSAHEASLNALSAAALSQSDSDAALHLARQRASDARAALERAKLQCAAAEDHERQAEMAAEEAKASHRALEAALAEAAQKLEACAAEVESARAAEEREAQKRQQQESQRQQEQQQAEAQQQAQWHCSSLAKAAPPARAHAASLESSLSPAPPCASLLGGGGAPLPAVDGHAELSRLLSSLSLERLMPMLQANDIDSVSSLRLLTDADYKEMGVSIGVRRKLLDALRACASSQPPTQPTGAATSPAAGMAACVAPTLRPKPGICSGGASAAPSAASAFSFIGGGASSGLLSAAHTAEGATAGGTGADGLFAGMGILDSGIGKLAGSTPAHSSFGHATGAQPAAAGPLSGGGCSCGPTTGPASCLHSMGSPVCAYGSCGASPGLLGFQGCMPPSSAPMSAGVSRSVALDADAFCCASQAPAQPSAANTDAASRTGSAFSFLS
uniref:SAM domain-containing protein n=2 Tax=Chrysotila carterae TaxID=13221 RepID=A0A7S4BEX1_CHRCT